MLGFGYIEVVVIIGIIVIIALLATKRVTPAIILIIGVSGLYYYSSFQKIEFYLDNAYIESIDVHGTNIIIDLRVYNPTFLPLYITGTTFDVYINGIYIAEGSSGGAIIPNSGYQTMSLPVFASYSGLSESLIDILTNGGRAIIEVKGKAKLFFINVLFRYEKTVTLL